MQVQVSESILGSPSYYHSSREGSSIVLPDLALRRVRGRSEGDQQVTFPGTRFVPLCLITSTHWMNVGPSLPPHPDSPVTCLTFPPGCSRS